MVEKSGIKIICENRKGRFHFEVLESFEAGIMLTGSEVKSLRAGGANIGDSYGMINKNEIFLLHTHIAPFKGAGVFNHEPMRMRKLLLHAHQISKLIGKVNEKGFALIPLKLYFKEGKVKVELALGKAKKMFDKRATIKKREEDRGIARAMRR